MTQNPGAPHSRKLQQSARVFFALAFIAASVTVALTALAIRAQKRRVETQRRADESHRLGDELRRSSDELTRFARTYVVTGDPKYRQYYEDVLAIRDGRKPRPADNDRVYLDYLDAARGPRPPDTRAVPLLQLLREQGFTDTEFEKLREAKAGSDALVSIERTAMHAMNGEFADGAGGFTRRGPPDAALAHRLLFDDAYHQAKARIMAPIDEFLAMADARNEAAVTRFDRNTTRYLEAFGAVVVLFCVMLAVSYPRAQNRVFRPVMVLQDQTQGIAADLGRLADVTERIARGDPDRPTFAVTATPVNSTRDDEIGELSTLHDSMIRQLQDTGASVARITTELASRQERLDDARRDLLAIIDRAPAGLLILNPDRSIRVQNQEATQLLGNPPLTNPERREYFTSIVYRTRDGTPLTLDETPPMRALLEGIEQYGLELEIERPDGYRASVLCGATPLRDDQGRLAGVVASFQDVTKLRELDRMKDEFVAIVSHELRTPLTAIRGALQLLSADESIGDAEDRELVDVSLQSCERLIRIVNDMLDISKIEAGKLELHVVPADVATVVDRAVAAIAPVARERRIAIERALSDSLPRIRGDVDRLTQVLVNLLSNALKFAPAGSAVTVSAERRDRSVAVAVADRGPGIAPADLPRLFRKFEQLNNAATRSAGGTGLGLSISKGIVEQHGGTLAVESRVGAGTTFRFTVPTV